MQAVRDPRRRLRTQRTARRTRTATLHTYLRSQGGDVPGSQGEKPGLSPPLGADSSGDHVHQWSPPTRAAQDTETQLMVSGLVDMRQ